MKIFLIFIFLSFNLFLHASSFVWKISKDDKYFYLAGTVHSLSKKDYPLSSAYKKAYKDSKILVFEADISKFQDKSFSFLINNKTRYKKEKISSFLSENTFTKLIKELKKRKLYSPSVLSLKPGMISIMLTVNELKKLGLYGPGVDMFYMQKALRDNKKIKYLESIYKQINFLSTMGLGYEDEFISYTLKDLKKLNQEFLQMKLFWKNGNTQKLEEFYLKPLKKSFYKLYEALIIKRNLQWMKKIKQMSKTKEVEFILVGALHLVGEHSLIKKLKTLNYKIEKLK